ncbi:phosphate butyryltransferase [Bacillus sp. FJAT-18017]|uniref:phosphate butyryltransferase n=1 Tax=Bacillus sp. FJAT-18017 TaxID=1705566 RepID=UPI0006AE041E|nr:phosphate butyryltransferase [Bacillus sp. FJAT-18017]ALC90005.1 phosphate butyryltransferase [Bacillus sp. FJAT-18017]
MFLDALLERSVQSTKRTVAVAAAADEEVLESVAEAIRHGMAKFILFGNSEHIETILEQIQLGLAKNTSIIIRDVQEINESAIEAVKAVSSGTAQVLMKGDIQTSLILRAVLNKEYGLRSTGILSHTAAFNIPGYERPIFVTDAAMNIAPNLEEKARIIQNAVSLATALGINNPKVAPVCAVETVNPAMQATLDAAELAAMNQKGVIDGCIIEGPLALDNAISPLAAEHKGIIGDVAGRADILLMPSIEAGNILYKSLVYFANAKVGGVLCGATSPIVLTSRSDSSESKLYSLALALCSSSSAI